MEIAHHFLSPGSMDSSSKSLHFHSFFRRVLIIPLGIFFLPQGLISLLNFFLSWCWWMSSHGLLSCPLQCRNENAVEVWLLQKDGKSMEKAWKINNFFCNTYLIGWQASDQESMVASKTVVSPHKPCHCLLYIVGNHPRVGDLSNSLCRDDA